MPFFLVEVAAPVRRPVEGNVILCVWHLLLEKDLLVDEGLFLTGVDSRVDWLVEARDRRCHVIALDASTHIAFLHRRNHELSRRHMHRCV